jgi:hypothetical protein
VKINRSRPQASSCHAALPANAPRPLHVCPYLALHIGPYADTIYQTSNVAHTMHSRIYASKGLPVVGELDPLMAETLNCWQTASHYLRLLSDVMADIGYDIESPL